MFCVTTPRCFDADEKWLRIELPATKASPLVGMRARVSMDKVVVLPAPNQIDRQIDRWTDIERKPLSVSGCLLATYTYYRILM